MYVHKYIILEAKPLASHTFVNLVVILTYELIRLNQEFYWVSFHVLNKLCNITMLNMLGLLTSTPSYISHITKIEHINIIFEGF